MKTYFFLFFMFFINLPNSSAKSDELHLDRTNTFHQVEYDYKIEYSKLEPSGCTTALGINKYHPNFSIKHGSRCNVNPAQRENINEIATSVSDIIEHFGLENNIKLMAHVYINIGWEIDHEPLIRFINYDQSWPINIHAYIKERYSIKHDRYIALREKLRKEIEESKIYDPIIKSMNGIGCEMTLSEYFVEGLFFDKHKITKDMLIEWGVFKEGEAKKDEYPFLKSPLTFKIKCR